MFPVLEVLVAIVIGLLYQLPAGDVPSPDWTGVLAMQLAGLLLCRIAARWSARPLARGASGVAVLTHERAFLGLRLAIIGLYFVQVWIFHWPRVTATLGIREWILVDEIIVLAPFFLHLLGTWSASYQVEKLFRFRRWSRSGYVLFQLRQRLLPLVPVFFLTFVYDVLDVLASWSPLVRRFQLLVETAVPVQWAVVGLSFVLVLILAPFLFRWFWGMRPMPDGPLRRRLEEFGRRVGFRTRDILYWPTNGNVLNAAIIGLVGRFRYVMITDGLIRSLSEDEIEAVYAHEVGHAKHRHMLLFLLFAISFLFVTHLMWLRLPDVFRPQSMYWMLAYTLIPMLLWWGVLFGWISRRLETQADVYGATATAKAHGDPDGSAFISALENLAEESGQIRHLRGLRHPSIDERTGFLRQYLADPEVRDRYRRSIRRLFLVLTALFLLIAGAAFATLPEEWRMARVRIALADGDRLGALDRCRYLVPGSRRDGMIAYTVNVIARSRPTEATALAAADRLVPLLREEDDGRLVSLELGRLLVLAAENARASSAFAHVEDAAPLLIRVARDAGESDTDLNIAAEASMLLGRAFVVLADGLVVDRTYVRLADGLVPDPLAGPSRPTTDEWRKTIWLARGWLERAETLEPEPEDGEPADLDHLALRGDLEAREGRFDEALAAYRAAGKAGAHSPASWESRVVDRRRRAPVGRPELMALADWISRQSTSPECLIVIAEILVTETRFALASLPRDRRRRAPLRLDEHRIFADMAGPLLRRLADPGPDDTPVPDRIRAGALLHLARLYRTLAEWSRAEGRDLAGWVLWRRRLGQLADGAETRASALR